MLVLFLLYLGILALWRAIEEPGQAARAVAILTLVGFINVPIVKFSVDWWNTLHQPASVFRLDGPTIHPAILMPLLFTATGFAALFLALLFAAMRNEILRRRVRTLRLLAAAEAR
jgi:heme exporter protein C